LLTVQIVEFVPVDIDLGQRPFPYEMVRLWLASWRRKLSPAEQKELDRLLCSRESGAEVASPAPLSQRRLRE
jgi:hypothetical protein